MLGIFEGKKEEYARLILKSLITDSNNPKTTTQIAEYLFFNRKSIVKPKTLNKYDVRQIVRIIGRKKGHPTGRLKELREKGYIAFLEDEGKWTLTPKGSVVALTCFNNTDELFNSLRKDIEEMNKERADLYKEMPFIIEVAQPIIDFCTGEKMLGLLRDSAMKLIKDGINFDKLSEYDVKTLIMSQLMMLLFAEELIKQKTTAMEKTLIPRSGKDRRTIRRKVEQKRDKLVRKAQKGKTSKHHSLGVHSTFLLGL